MSIDHPDGNKLMKALAPRFLNGIRMRQWVTVEGVHITWKNQVFDYLSEDTAALTGQDAWVCFNFDHPETIAISVRQDFFDFKIVPRVVPPNQANPQ